MPKNYSYADLSVKGALKLKIGDICYDVTQYSATFPVNDIPKASCLLALGRLAPKATEAAQIHTENKLESMAKCEVTFSPSGEYHPDGRIWPEGETVIFRGYFVGFAYRKVLGKILVTANLIHWMFDLACSSVTCGNSHPANTQQLNSVAVLGKLGDTGAIQPSYISAGWITGKLEIDNIFQTDLWGGIHAVFCALAEIPTAPVHALADRCFVNSDIRTARENKRALRALKRLETTAAKKCPFTPDDGSAGKRYAVPLALRIKEPYLHRAIEVYIGNSLTSCEGTTTMWDKLITELCPQFGLAVVPMVERGLVIADLPSYSGGFWREIDHTEYDSFDMSGSLEQPLRAVSVVADVMSVTGAMREKIVTNQVFGGCFAAKSLTDDDGVVRYVSPPRWIQSVVSSMFLAGNATNEKNKGPAKEGSSDTPGLAPNKPTPESDPTFVQKTNDAMGAYAQQVYVNSMLRGRNGSLSGKLRFDIAPGSIVKIKQRGEQHLEKDDLASTMFACVSHVTVTINAEAGLAATSFLLTHVRREFDENSSPRTSCDQHPFFTSAIHGGGKHGAPLIPKYELTPGQAPINSVLGNPGLGGGLNAAGLA